LASLKDKVSNDPKGGTPQGTAFLRKGPSKQVSVSP
jgi:hypothetical protein